jgi:CheY-like chemotaxis protein
MEKLKIVRKPIPFGKVLVVDDLDMNIYVIKGMLSPYGLQIDTAVSGHEAIEKIKKNTYDLVFMDHMMPVMDGVETVRKIREWENEEFKKKTGLSEAKLPIIALTANAVSGMSEMFLANGFNGFISKPIVLNELDEVLKKWLSPEKITQGEKPETPVNDETYDGFIKEIEKINEIDTKIGLKQVTGSKEMYRNTLKIFYEKLIAVCNDMTAFLEAKDMENFSVSVHSTKTMLSIIGASNLSEMALTLERASEKNGVDFCILQFAEFKEELLSLHKKLAAIFPVNTENSEDDSKSSNINSTPAGKKSFTGKILLVDDTKMVLYVIKEKLMTYGLQVDTVASGPEAIEKIKTNEYDLVFMDYKMPKMNGIEATMEIRKLGAKYEKLTIIALTANMDTWLEEKFLAAGFNGFLSKPVETEKLEEIFKEWL